jgi:hypothetical protein
MSIIPSGDLISRGGTVVYFCNYNPVFIEVLRNLAGLRITDMDVWDRGSGIATINCLLNLAVPGDVNVF